MPGKTKVYDEAQEAAGELRRAMFAEFVRNDGVIDEHESHLLGLADGVCVLSRRVRLLIGLVMRMLGGGRLDRGMMADVRVCLEDEETPAVGDTTGVLVEIDKAAA